MPVKSKRNGRCHVSDERLNGNIVTWGVMIHAAILTSSDQGAAGARADSSGDLLERLLAQAGATIVARALLPDDRAGIAAQIAAPADNRQGKPGGPTRGPG